MPSIQFLAVYTEWPGHPQKSLCANKDVGGRVKPGNDTIGDDATGHDTIGHDTVGHDTVEPETTLASLEEVRDARDGL